MLHRIKINLVACSSLDLAHLILFANEMLCARVKVVKLDIFLSFLQTPPLNIIERRVAALWFINNILHLLDPPEGTTLTTSAASDTAVKGDQVTFTCTATGANPAVDKYKFYFNNSNTPIAENSKGTYQINDVQGSDQGTYKCVPHNDAGDGEVAAVMLTVNGKLSMKPFKCNFARLLVALFIILFVCCFIFSLIAVVYKLGVWINTLMLQFTSMESLISKAVRTFIARGGFSRQSKIPDGKASYYERVSFPLVQMQGNSVQFGSLLYHLFMFI